MKNILFLSLTIVLLLSLGACGSSVDKAKEDFCQDVGDVGQAAIDLRQINLTSSKGDLQDAVNDLEKALGNLESSAQNLGEAKVDGLKDAVGDLKDTLSDLPDGDFSAEELVDAKGAVIETMAEVQQISITVCSYPQE
jgi:peptidoglycan hydrolase CwlO-like protein